MQQVSFHVGWLWGSNRGGKDACRIVDAQPHDPNISGVSLPLIRIRGPGADRGWISDPWLAVVLQWGMRK